MPCTIKHLTLHGLAEVDYQAESLNAAVRYEPEDGVYTVANTFNTFQVLKFDAHLDRLEDSARRAGIPFTLNRVHLRQGLRQMIAGAGYGDVRFRLTVPRNTPDTLILSIEPFVPQPQSVYEQGVRCITAPNSARDNAAAKTTGWMHKRGALQAKMTNGIYDTFLLSADGHLLEGLGSNFYAILDDELRTAGAGVLYGISRQIVFTVAEGIIPVREEAAHQDDIPQLQEAFLSSSSRGIVPVVEIDGVKIGAGVPGAKTRALRAAYLAWVDAHLEEL